MTRKRPSNRIVTECHKVICEDRKKGIVVKMYLHVDREPSDGNGLSLGPVCGVRITPDNAIAGTLLEDALKQISETISREVQTTSKELGEAA